MPSAYNAEDGGLRTPSARYMNERTTRGGMAPLNVYTRFRDGTTCATLRHLTAVCDVDVLPRNRAVAVLLHEQLVLFSYLRFKHGNTMHEGGGRGRYPWVRCSPPQRVYFASSYQSLSRTSPMRAHTMNLHNPQAPNTLRAKRRNFTPVA